MKYANGSWSLSLLCASLCYTTCVPFVSICHSQQKCPVHIPTQSSIIPLKRAQPNQKQQVPKTLDKTLDFRQTAALTAARLLHKPPVESLELLPGVAELCNYRGTRYTCVRSAQNTDALFGCRTMYHITFDRLPNLCWVRLLRTCIVLILLAFSLAFPSLLTVPLIILCPGLLLWSKSSWTTTEKKKKSPCSKHPTVGCQPTCCTKMYKHLVALRIGLWYVLPPGTFGRPSCQPAMQKVKSWMRSGVPGSSTKNDLVVLGRLEVQFVGCHFVDTFEIIFHSCSDATWCNVFVKNHQLNYYWFSGLKLNVLLNNQHLFSCWLVL